MKAFKGCVSEQCVAYKRVKYKTDDNFCSKCGNGLHFVCADCWTILDDNAERYCLSCAAERKDRRENRKEQAKDRVKKAGAAVPVVIGAVANVANHTDAAAKVAQKAKAAAKNVVNVVVKK